MSLLCHLYSPLSSLPSLLCLPSFLVLCVYLVSYAYLDSYMHAHTYSLLCLLSYVFPMPDYIATVLPRLIPLGYYYFHA